jgi:hypothetical protein
MKRHRIHDYETRDDELIDGYVYRCEEADVELAKLQKRPEIITVDPNDDTTWPLDDDQDRVVVWWAGAETAAVKPYAVRWALTSKHGPQPIKWMKVPE